MAKNNSEAKIKFTAETSSFNSAINKAESELKVLRAELKLNETQMKNTGESAEGLENSQKLLTAQLEQAQSKTEALRGKLDKAIEIYGEGSNVVANYKRAVANARIEEENISRKIATVTEKLEKQENAAEGSANANEKLTDKLSRQERELSDLKSEYVEAVVKFGSASKEAQDLARQIDDLSGELKANKTSMATAEKAADELDNSLDEVEKSAGKAGETLKNIGGTVAKGAVAGLKAIAAAGAAVGTALVGSSVSAAGYADEMLTMSTVTGVSTDKLQAYKYASELVDVSVETMTKSMAKNIKSMKGAQDGSKAYAEAYQKLGVSVMDANGNLRDGETVYWECIDALGKMENETERDALAMQIFGKSAQELNPMIEAGAEKMQELTKEAEEVGAVMSGDTLNALGAFDDSIQRLKGSASAAKNALGSVLLPELQSITDTSGALLGDFTKNLNASGGGIDGFISTISGMSGQIGTALGDIVGKISGIITKGISAVAQILPSLIETLLPNLISGVVSLIGSLASTLPSLLDSIFAVIPSLISGIVSATKEIVTYLPDVIESICSALPTLIPELISGVTSVVVMLCESFGSIIQPLIDSLPDIIISIVEAIVTNLPALIDGIITLVMGIVEAIPQIIQGLVDALPTIISLLISSLLSNLPKIIGGLIQVVWGIVSSLPQIFGSLIEGIGNIFVGIWNGIKDVFAKLGNWFSEKFGEGVQAIKDVFGKIGEWFSGVWDGIKNVFSNIGGWFKEKFSNAKENATNAWSNAKEKFSNIKDKVTGAFSNVGTWFKTKFGDAKENSVNAWSNIKSKFTSIKDKITGAFKDIKTKLSEPFTKARDKIKEIADKIKGFFKGDISMPKIKTPKFSISPKGWKVGDLLKGSIPKLSIKWNAEGGILTRPTIFGARGNTLFGGGEAGHEAILPISKLEDYIVGAIEKTVNVVNFESLAAAIEDLANRPTQLNINGREFAYATASDTDSVGGMRNSFVSRGLIVD